MTHAARCLATGSILALMTAFSLTAASAQDRNQMQRPSSQENCVGVECMPDSMNKPDRMQRQEGDESGKMKGDSNKRRKVTRDGNDNDKDHVERKREARSDWKFDPNRHHRSRNKDSRYRYYYGGYWYLEPYWTMPFFSLDDAVLQPG